MSWVSVGIAGAGLVTQVASSGKGGQKVGSSPGIPVNIAPSTPIQLPEGEGQIGTAPSSGFATLGAPGGSTGGGGRGGATSLIEKSAAFGQMFYKAQQGSGGKGKYGDPAVNQAMFRAGPNQTLDF